MKSKICLRMRILYRNTRDFARKFQMGNEADEEWKWWQKRDDLWMRIERISFVVLLFGFLFLTADCRLQTAVPRLLPLRFRLFLVSAFFLQACDVGTGLF